MVNRFVENLLNRVRDAQRGYEASILSGSFKTFDDYKLVCGKLNGIKEIEDLINHLYKQSIETVTLKDVRSKTYE